MKSLQNMILSDLKRFFSVAFPRKQLKIAMISYYYPAPGNICVSGVGIYTYFISRELAKLGCDVHVFIATDKNSEILRENVGKGKLTIHKISTYSRRKEKDPIIQRRMIYLNFENKIPKEISKENEKGKFDIINTNGWLTSGAFIAKQFTNVKWVHTFHAVEKKRERMMSKEVRKYLPLHEWIEKTIKYSDYFISVSKNLKHEIIRTYNISSRRIFVIPNGIDPSIFKPKKIDKGKLRKKYGFNKNHKIIMTVSRFSKEKGITTLIDTIPIVLNKNKKYAFLLILPLKKKYKKVKSFEELYKKLEELIEKYKKRIKLIIRPVSQKTLSKLYNMADLYIQPSLYEAFGITILEAMACGNAIVASNCGGIPEIVFNGYNGLLVEPGEPKYLARDIIKILDSPKFKNKLEKNSVKFAKKYTWEKLGKQTLEFYRKLS